MSSPDCDSTSGTKPAASASDAGFGIAILDANGIVLFSNRHGSDPAPDGINVRTQQCVFRRGGETFTVCVEMPEDKPALNEEALFRKAYFDELTGLPNYQVVATSAELLAVDISGRFALAIIGLDGLPGINDYLGRAAGDAVLERLAARLADILRDTDLLARLRGDEFALLLSPLENQADAEERILHLLERLKEPLQIDGREILTSATIGVSMFPEDGETYDELEANADRAMSVARKSNKGSLRFFDHSMQEEAEQRSRIEQILRHAILDRRIRCAYQPKVDIRTGDVRGLEVLMRWEDEDGTIRSPGEVLPLASELGLMVQLTNLILDQTISAIDRINEAFGRECSISINVAAVLASDKSYMQGLLARMEDTGFAHRFTIEVTEEAFVEKTQFQTIILPMIRAIGAKVSIDDFGTGYSSLSALADITADELKIDRSFITDVHKKPRNQSVLRAIEALGHSLGMTITAEGVETEEELTYLQTQTGIDVGQGHYFAKAIMLNERSAPEHSHDSGRARAPTRAAAVARG